MADANESNVNDIAQLVIVDEEHPSTQNENHNVDNDTANGDGENLDDVRYENEDDGDDDDDDVDIWEEAHDDDQEIQGVFDNYRSDDDAIEIDNDEDDDDVKDDDCSTQQVYDQSLPPAHSYMGDDMEELHGRTIRDDGEIMLMPLLYLPGLVLVPGQILPLNLFHPQAIAIMQKVISADKTFGLLFGRSRRFNGNSSASFFADVGVTCEVFSVKYDELQQGSMSIKGEGRQRFQILSKTLQIDGTMMGKIRILPDDNLPPCPNESLLYTHYLHACSVKAQRMNNKYMLRKKWKDGVSRYMLGFRKESVKFLNTSLTPHPGWIYRMYDPFFLMDQLLREIRSWNNNIDFETLPMEPEGFSHWITSNLPLTNDMKIQLLQINSANLRLRRQIEIMRECATTLACDGCGSIIADKNDLFSLSKRGPMDAYVNPGGHVHETLTFYKAKNISISGRATTEYSWFPGYAWTIASCKTCHDHLGWKFTGAKKGLKPVKFWGLTRTSLRPIFKESGEKSPTDERPNTTTKISAHQNESDI